MDKVNLKELVSRGELEPAFAALLAYGQSRKSVAWYNALLIQYNQFKNLKQNMLQGVLSAEEEGRARNRILSALLSLIDDLPEEKNGGPAEVSPNPGSSHIRRPQWVLIGVIVLLGLLVVYFKPTLFTPATEAEAFPAGSDLPVENPATARPLSFPEGNAVTFIFSTGNEISYRLLNGAWTDLGGGARQLSFTIRCTARKGNGANFWDDTFRLELDEPGALLAPSSGLNEVVENNSFKDGVVSFVVNEPFSRIKLAIANPWDKEDIRMLAVAR